MYNELLEDDLTSATTLNLICLKLYGTDYLNWEPETVRLELSEITEDIPDINFDKLQAVSTLMTTEQFYTYWEAFECIGSCLNMNDPFFMVATPLDAMKVCWTVIESKLNDEDITDFSSEVLGYIETVFKSNGILRVPEAIKKHIKLNYDVFDDLNPTQQGYQIEFENELNTFLGFRLKRIKNELSSAGLDSSD